MKDFSKPRKSFEITRHHVLVETITKLIKQQVLAIKVVPTTAEILTRVTKYHAWTVLTSIANTGGISTHAKILT